MTPDKYVELRDRIALLKARTSRLLLQKGKNNTFVPPSSVRSAARRGLELREKWKRGGLDNSEASDQGIGSGVQRAVNLKNGDAISLATVKRMAAFFSRHQKNYRPDKKEPDGGPTAGYISHMLWGGPAGEKWARSIVARAESAESVGKQLGASSVRFGTDMSSGMAGFRGAQSRVESGVVLRKRSGDFSAGGFAHASTSVNRSATFSSLVRHVSGVVGEEQVFNVHAPGSVARVTNVHVARNFASHHGPDQSISAHATNDRVVAPGSVLLDPPSPDQAPGYGVKSGFGSKHFEQGGFVHKAKMTCAEADVKRKLRPTEKANAGYTPSAGWQANDGKPEFMAYAKDGDGAPAGGPDAGDVHVPSANWKAPTKPKKSKRKGAA